MTTKPKGGARCPHRAFVDSLSGQPDEDIGLHYHVAELGLAFVCG